MKTGWLNDKGNWYYFYSEGNMAHDCYIDEYYLNSSGAWTSELPEKYSEIFIENKNQGIRTQGLEKNLNVYLSVSGKKYHLKSNCPNLNGKTILKTIIAEAEAMGFEKCTDC